MGVYYEPGMERFSGIVKREDYKDKTGLIGFVNRKIEKGTALICVTRPRRFGKTFAARMLAAYYDRSCDSSALFENRMIAQDPTFRDHLNQYHVLSFTVTNFTSRIDTSQESDVSGRMVRESGFISLVENRLCSELRASYPNVVSEKDSLEDMIFQIWCATGVKFVVIIDEWDAVFREFPKNSDIQKKWVHFLRRLFKSEQTLALAGAYMTGILPIKRYGTQSALTDFAENTMLDPHPIEPFFGFSEDEVKSLLKGTELNFDDVRAWYDGYNLNGMHIYNPVSVLDAVERGKIRNYWNQTESFEALRIYIDMDFQGLHEDLSQMYWGGRIPVDSGNFQNDLTSIQSKSDVFTLLVHLGYLTYDGDTGTVFIPNQELRDQFRVVLKHSRRDKTIELIQKSEELLDAIWDQDEVQTAKLIEEFHESGSTPLKYNNEDCLRGVLCMALLTSADTYSCFQELPSGKGYVDMLFLPLPGKTEPALLVELKWNKKVDSAIQQILDRNYPQVLSNYSGEILLVGITYQATSRKKEHSCRIRKFVKP